MPHLLFADGTGLRSAVSLLQSLPDNGFDVVGFGLAQHSAVVARSRRAVAGDGPDAEVERIVFAGGLGIPVFRSRSFPLAHFNAEIAVAQVRERSGSLPDQCAQVGPERVQRFDADAGGHWRS